LILLSIESQILDKKPSTLSDKVLFNLVFRKHKSSSFQIYNLEISKESQEKMFGKSI